MNPTLLFIRDLDQAIAHHETTEVKRLLDSVNKSIARAYARQYIEKILQGTNVLDILHLDTLEVYFPKAEMHTISKQRMAGALESANVITTPFLAEYLTLQELNAIFKQSMDEARSRENFHVVQFIQTQRSAWWYHRKN